MFLLRRRPQPYPRTPLKQHPSFRRGRTFSYPVPCPPATVGKITCSRQGARNHPGSTNAPISQSCALREPDLSQHCAPKRHISFIINNLPEASAPQRFPGPLPIEPRKKLLTRRTTGYTVMSAIHKGEVAQFDCANPSVVSRIRSCWAGIHP